MKANLSRDEIREHLLSGAPWIDVRAPIEFAAGHLPAAVNLPLLNDEERAAVGTTYKLQGSEAAIALGHQLVTGEIKSQRVEAWRQFAQQNPSAILYCFRGGMRSQISRQWLRDTGIDRPLLEGGYKVGRTFLIEEIERICTHSEFINIGGASGCGKTHLLQEAADFRATVDLEALARHRGSAFGKLLEPQPSPVLFENELALSLLTAERQGQAILLEDESRTIGALTLPVPVFTAISNAPMVWIDEPLASRTDEIFRVYIQESAIGRGLEPEARRIFEGFKRSTEAITKRLGGLRATAIKSCIEACEQQYFEQQNIDCNKEWISQLLEFYYDAFYFEHLSRRKPNIKFKGSYKSCLEFLKEN